MNSILYFVKGRPSKSEVEKTFKNHPKFQRMDNVVGVHGVGGGTMLTDTRGPNPALDEDSQVWKESAEKKLVESSGPDGEITEEPLFWFGWQMNRKPGPEDLQKPEIIDGDLYRGWIIPKVRTCYMYGNQITPWTRLPKDPVWDGEQFRPGEVCEQYREIAALGEEVWTLLMELQQQQTEFGKMTLPNNAMKLVYRIVSINYYMGPDEFAALGVVPYEFWQIVEVMRIFSGYNDALALLSEQQKKTDRVSE
jgi:hypothetical protein